MEVVHARCCGIDVHQASLAVCVTIKEEGKSDKHKLRCGTTTAELLRLADWLHGYQVTQVAMEATGVYWKPVWHILEGQLEMLLAIVGGEMDPAALAQLARKRLRGKIPVLQQAATGTLNEHHRFLIEQWLALWDELVLRIHKFEERIEEQMRPFAAVVETWTSLPGIDRITAWTI